MLKTFRWPALAGLTLLFFVGFAQAQATRTWVSGVGDDVNPCSRTAPCKTFAGAISKTAANGEISVLDPGGYGAITITKAITINGTGTLPGILSSGTTGVIVNAGANDVVVLRGISINGAGNGLHGIRFLAGKALHVEDVEIQGVVGNGIEFVPSGTASLYVDGVTILNTQLGTTSITQAGILVKPGTTGEAYAAISNTRVEGSFIGVLVQDRARAVISNSTISRNTQIGAWVQSLATGPSSLVIKDSTFANNGPVATAITSGQGLRAEGTNAVMRISNTSVTGSQIGLYFTGNGALLSYGNNQVSGNTSDGGPSGFITDI